MVSRKALDACVKLEMKDIYKGTTYAKACYKSLRERWMTPNNTLKKTFSKIRMHIEMDQFIKVRHRTVKVRSNEKTEFHYRAKAVLKNTKRNGGQA